MQFLYSEIHLCWTSTSMSFNTRVHPLHPSTLRMGGVSLPANSTHHPAPWSSVTPARVGVGVVGSHGLSRHCGAQLPFLERWLHGVGWHMLFVSGFFHSAPSFWDWATLFLLRVVFIVHTNHSAFILSVLMMDVRALNFDKVKLSFFFRLQVVFLVSSSLRNPCLLQGLRNILCF